MYQDAKMLESIRKVEAAREANLRLDPARMTAEEKDVLLKTYHPDYRESQFSVLDFGPNKGGKVPIELKKLLEGQSRLLGKPSIWSTRTTRLTFSSSAAAARARLLPSKPTRRAQRCSS